MSFKSNGLDLKGGVIGMGVLWMMTVQDSERLSINLPSKLITFGRSTAAAHRTYAPFLQSMKPKITTGWNKTSGRIAKI